MDQVVNNLAYVYMQTGVTGLFFIVVMALVIWYFTKGRKQVQAERDKMISEQARTNVVISNNTAVVENCTKVIEANTRARIDEKRSLENLVERVTRHGDQLDAIERNQAVCLDRQTRK